VQAGFNLQSITAAPVALPTVLEQVIAENSTATIENRSEVSTIATNT
jgi:hypothetical protein